MRSRREQMQAYRFVTRRIVSGMLSGEPETTELPMRRLGGSLIGSCLIGVIVLAVVAVYGYMNPAGGTPAEGEIIVMRETGSRFIYQDKLLHPVSNFTSAQLILGPSATVHTMSRGSLAKVPRGLPLGIEGAPDPVPDRKALLGLPWSVCSLEVAGSTNLLTQLRVGALQSGSSVLGTQGILVTTSQTGELPIYLLLGDFRLKVDDRMVLTALGLASVTPIRVTTQVLNSIPAGPDLAPLKLPKAGTPSSKQVAGQTAQVGQVYHNAEEYYVLTAEGLAPIGQVMATLLTSTGTQAATITAKQAADALANVEVEPSGFPKTKPQVRTQDRLSVCAVYRDSAVASGQNTQGRTVSVEVVPAGNGQSDASSQAAAVGAGGGRLADQVLVAQGHGALVRPLPAAGVSAQTTVYLITDQGLSFPLGAATEGSSQSDAKDCLGYSTVTPVAVPSAILALIPAGPELSAAAASKYVNTGSAGASGSANASPKRSQTSSGGSKSNSGSSSAPAGNGNSSPGKPSSPSTSPRPSVVTSSRRRVRVLVLRGEPRKSS